MRCARAFGALIEMRDDPMDAPIPDEFKPSDYHVKALDYAKSRQAAVAEMTLEQAAADLDEANRKSLASRQESRQRSSAQRQAYERMIGMVESYQPPSPDHVKYKQFMLDQLRESLKFDCHDEAFLTECYKTFDVTPAEWLAKIKEQADRDVEYHTQHLAEDIERANSRTLWVKQLRESLKKAV